jgi:hypothetical protein
MRHPKNSTRCVVRRSTGRVSSLLFVPLAVTIGILGCDSIGPEPRGSVQVLLTDAPSDRIAAAEVWISRVYLQGDGEDEVEEGVEGDEEGGRVDLFNDPADPRSYDLLTLRDGVTADLTGTVEVPAGRYAQLRLVVDSARVTLIEGFTFANGDTSRSLFVPSGSSSGIKVQLAEPVESSDSETSVVLVDFDVDANFVFQGPPGAPNGVLFTPTLRQIPLQGN